MLTPALRVGETGSTGPMDRTCVSTGRSPETSGPSSPECTDPQRWRPSRRQPPPRTGVLRARLLRPAGRHAMVVAHFFESGQRRRLRWGRVESAPLMAGAVALASTGYIAAIDEKGLGGATSARPGRPGFPQREPGIAHGDSSRAEYAQAQGRVILLERGLGSQPSCGRRGQAVVRRTVPLRSLDDWLVPACYQ